MNLPNFPNYIYLHGFASSPQSAKANYLRDCFWDLGLQLKTPDLNQGDFSRLTLTRQLQQVESEFLVSSLPGPKKQEPGLGGVTIIGSSFGGLTAAWLAQRQPSVERIVLLAPAFQFVSHWLPKLGEQQLAKWQSEGYLSVYHYSEKRDLPLSYQLILDLVQYQEERLVRPVPTLIFHGQQDEVIPVQASREFVAKRPWVKLVEVADDHSLANTLPEIWNGIQEFCQLNDLQFN
ncbi:MAG: YqiA/YcfP family alpha/beta fold hydrolase [Actinomycetota bacterium]